MRGGGVCGRGYGGCAGGEGGADRRSTRKRGSKKCSIKSVKKWLEKLGREKWLQKVARNGGLKQ